MARVEAFPISRDVTGGSWESPSHRAIGTGEVEVAKSLLACIATRNR